eukprot:GHUV01028216.1.p1 GENE.GHUV01028216.1~~GHUV01028216.1.p1  ORF type:complete len:193 (-),score=23.04 GHUV01028216.1:790-1368(-)
MIASPLRPCFVLSCLQGAVSYNNTDGSSYVTVKDTPSTPPSTPAAAAAGPAPSRIVTEATPAANQQKKQPQDKTHARRFLLQSPKSNNITTNTSGSTNSTRAGAHNLDSLFEAATKGNCSYQQWVKSSSSKTDATGWRRLITWPFGEDGGVFRMNKAGDAVYLVSSLGRYAWSCGSLLCHSYYCVRALFLCC